MRPFAVPADLRTFVQDETVPEETARQKLAIASGAVRSFCGWPVSAVTETKRIRATNAQSLWLPTLHLRGVSSITLAGQALTGFDFTDEGQVLLGRWYYTRGPYVVTFDHGWLDDSYQIETVRGVVLSCASRLLDNPNSYRSWTTGSESVTAAGGGSDIIGVLADGEKTQIADFVIPVLG